jgi:hypothetical protein
MRLHTQATDHDDDDDDGVAGVGAAAVFFLIMPNTLLTPERRDEASRAPALEAEASSGEARGEVGDSSGD